MCQRAQGDGQHRAGQSVGFYKGSVYAVKHTIDNSARPATLYVLNATTGELTWQYDFDTPVMLTGVFPVGDDKVCHEGKGLVGMGVGVEACEPSGSGNTRNQPKHVI